MRDIKSSKLLALHKAAVGQERTVLQEKLRIEKIVEERFLKLKNLEDKKESIELEVVELEKKEKLRALQKSDIEKVQTITAYVNRLQQELEELLESINHHSNDYESAKMRLEDYSEELRVAKVERKKIEKLIESHSNADLLKKEAFSEAQLEDRAGFKGKN